MPGKVIPCALCQEQAAAFYCVNDDAHLCTSCDASVHANNPLLARHERRPLTALTCQAESAARSGAGASAPSTTTDADVAVVPQLGGGEEGEVAGAFTSPLAEPVTGPAPLALYEDSFLARSLSASDLLDLDSDELELPALPFSFDPMADCVVPSFDDLRPAAAADAYFGAAPAPTFGSQQSSFLPQQPAYHPYMRPQQQQGMVPLGSGTVARPAAVAQQRTPEEAAEEAARVARHRERQRKKRNFGRAVRYQSRRAYAEIRPRIKGRFVTPEEYAAYQAQAAGGDKAGYQAHAAFAAAPQQEEDAVVPVPSFGLA